MDFTDVIDTQWSPQLGLIWQATPATTLKALYGRAHRAPNAYERDYDDASFNSPIRRWAAKPSTPWNWWWTTAWPPI